MKPLGGRFGASWALGSCIRFVVFTCFLYTSPFTRIRACALRAHTLRTAPCAPAPSTAPPHPAPQHSAFPPLCVFPSAHSTLSSRRSEEEGEETGGRKEEGGRREGGGSALPPSFGFSRGAQTSEVSDVYDQICCRTWNTWRIWRTTRRACHAWAPARRRTHGAGFGSQ